MLPMTFSMALTPELRQVQSIARELAADFATRAAQHDRERTSPMENYARLRDAGLYGICVPEQYGGMGHGLLGWAVAGEELGQGCGSTALSFNMHVMVTGIVKNDPTIPEAVKERFFDLVVRQGKLISGVLSEPTASGHLAPSFAPSLVARKVEGGWKLYGKKHFASMWEASDFCHLGVAEEGNPNPQAGIVLLVDTHAEGVTVHDTWHTFGMRATRSQTVSLDGVFVPEANLLYRTDALIQTLLGRDGAWSFGAYTSVYLGVGVAILNKAKELLLGRVAKGFAQPMAYHPDTRRRVAQMASHLDAARLALWQAAWLYDTTGPGMESLLALLKAKLLVGQAVTQAAREVQLACGAHALFVESGVERLIRDAATANIQPPNEDLCLSMIGMLEMGLNPDDAVIPVKMAVPVQA